jgi:HEAT repeat protein
MWLRAVVIFLGATVACVVIASLLWLVQLLYRQHRYQHQGRPLNDWLRDYDSPHDLYDLMMEDPDELKPQLSFERECAIEQGRRLKADVAVRAIGPKTVPWLIEMLKPHRRLPEWLEALTPLCLNRIRFGCAQPCEIITIYKRRRRALDALAALGPQASATTPILERLEVEGITWLDGARALAKMGDPGIAALNRMLSNANLDVRAASALYLSFSGCKSREVFNVMVEAVHSGHTPVRAVNAIALSQFPSEASVATPVLLEALTHDDPIVRSNATFTLGYFKDQRAVIEPVLDRLQYDDGEPHVREAARHALKMLQDDGTTPAMVAINEI